jgi:hypothetical protein
MSFDAKRKRRAYNERVRKRKRAVRTDRVQMQDLSPEFGIRSRFGRITKLTKQVYDSVCGLLAEGQTLECAATLSGVDSSTLWAWVRDGQVHSDGPFGQFSRDVAYAKEISHRYLVHKIAIHDDWKAAAFLLKNKFPKLYRDSISQEIQGPDGAPIPIAQTFSVVLELHQPESQNNERQPEREFRIDPLLGPPPVGAGRPG